jgi:PAS domain S-box-containing protein
MAGDSALSCTAGLAHTTKGKELKPMSETASNKPRAPQELPDALFRAAADQAPQVMWIINVKGAVTYLNRAWYELVGGAPPRWQGHEWGELVAPDDLVRMRENWKSASEHGAIFEGSRRVKALDGTWHTLSYRATPVWENGRVVCWVGMDADITELMAVTAALRVANQELEAFSYSVSHDLRTPLITVHGYAQRLSKELGAGASEKAHHYVTRITEAINHMSRLVDGLLALSHVARRPLKTAEVDLSAIAAGILEELQRNDPSRHVVASVHPGLRVRADARLVDSLLENLLANAWKFTSGTPHAQISVGLESRVGGELVFFVKDNGPGFDMAHAGHLFHAFQRLHTANEFPGTGIGLATVSRIAVRHGGRAWVASTPGQGACFYVALPEA